MTVWWSLYRRALCHGHFHAYVPASMGPNLMGQEGRISEMFPIHYQTKIYHSLGPVDILGMAFFPAPEMKPAGSLFLSTVRFSLGAEGLAI